MMKSINNKNILIVLLSFLVFFSAIITYIISARVSSQQPVSLNAPESTPLAASCKEECPGSDGVLRSCHPKDSDGTSNESLCNRTGRIETCGPDYTEYCCNGKKWTKDMSACTTDTPTPTATQTPSPTVTVSPTSSISQSPTPTPTGTNIECASCTKTADCVRGLFCDVKDGKCKNNQTVCWVGANSCTVTAATVCIPKTGVVTCSPDCPTECGNPAKNISSCVDSCEVTTTKSCPATTACKEDLLISQKIYKNELGNTAKKYNYVEEINTAAVNQTLVYAIELENKGDVPFDNLVITDLLTTNNMDKVIFVDANNPCYFSSSSRKITCPDIKLDPNSKLKYGFRVKVGSNVKNGDVLKNIVSVNKTDSEKSISINTLVKCNQVCTDDSQCLDGLSCDTKTNTCRNKSCVLESDCSCPVVAVSSTPTPSSPTPSPTLIAQVSVTPTLTVTKRPTGTAEPLPSTGIFDIPGFALFGGGLLMTIIGILLAL